MEIKIKIKLDPKFRDGDKIWIIRKCLPNGSENIRKATPRYKWRTLGPYIIKNIEVEYAIYVKIIYIIDDIHRNWIDERDSFTTLNRAQKECDRRNNGKEMAYK